MPALSESRVYACDNRERATQAVPAGAGRSASATLQQLQSTEPGLLLEGLLAASPNAAFDEQCLLIRALGDDSAEVRNPPSRLLVVTLC